MLLKLSFECVKSIFIYFIFKESQRPTIEDILNSPGVRAYKNRSETSSAAIVNQLAMPQEATKLYALPYKR